MSSQNQPVSIRQVAPFLRAPHGFAVSLEHPERPIRTVSGEVVVMMLGIVHGTYDELCAQADYAIARAKSQGSEICAIIDASHPSFRFPDAMLRRLFKHLRQHERYLRHIIFVGMPHIVRIGFRLATPFLGETLRERIRILSKAQLDDWLAPSDLPMALEGSWDLDIEEYIRLRAEEEQVEVDDTTREFNPQDLASANEALRSAINQAPLLDDAFFTCEGEKRGNGGWGSKRWKGKHFFFMPATLVYGEGKECFESSTISLTESRLERVDSVLQLSTSERSYLFRFGSKETELQFEDAYYKALKLDPSYKFDADESEACKAICEKNQLHHVSAIGNPIAG